jgi:hypothetical protein
MWPNILVGYAGHSPPSIRTPFRGTLVAPSANIVLRSTETSHSGSFYGRSMALEPGTLLEGRGFMSNSSRLPDARVACQGCASLVTRVSRECCHQQNRTETMARSSARQCMAACSANPGGSLAQCHAQCGAWLARQKAAAAAASAECRDGASFAYSECMLMSGLRPDTCHKLGYSIRRPTACHE